MKKNLFILVIFLTVILLPVVHSQFVYEGDIDCEIEPGDYCTQTQGGWGAACKGNNPGCLRDNNWDTVTGGTLTVGIGNQLVFTSASAVEDYLPAGGTPASLTTSHTDPTITESGVFGGQVTALKLNVLFSDAGIGLSTPTGDTTLGELYIAYGPFAGMTVYEFLALAETVLGGGSLPPGTTVSDVNYAATAINENFDNCVENNGFLIIDPSCEHEEPETGNIIGYKWDDADKDGIKDPEEGIISGVLITLYDAQSSIVATTITDENGYFEFTELEPGEYTVIETTPMGWFSSTPNSVIAIVVEGQDTEVGFGNYMVVYGDGSGDFRTIGFWKHNFGVATGNNKGKAQIGTSDLLHLLSMLNEDWTTYAGLTLTSAYSLLDLKKADMDMRARQQCFATMLNYASGAVGWYEEVDTDYDGVLDMMFSEAMEDALSGDDYENNKNICDSINNMGESDGNMITGGAISELGEGLGESGLLIFLGLTGMFAIIILHVTQKP